MTLPLRGEKGLLFTLALGAPADYDTAFPLSPRSDGDVAEPVVPAAGGAGGAGGPERDHDLAAHVPASTAADEAVRSGHNTRG